MKEAAAEFPVQVDAMGARVQDAAQALGFEYKDVVGVRVAIYYDWWDRLRILFGKTAHVSVRVRTQHDVGIRYVEPTIAYVDHVFPSRGGPMSLGEGEPK